MKYLSQPRARYLIPSVLCAIVLAGLISALLGDGLCDLLSWVALTIPLVVIVFFLNRGAKSRWSAPRE